MSSAADLQDITSRIESLLLEIRAIEGSPSLRPVRTKLQFDESPGRRSTGRQSPEQHSPGRQSPERHSPGRQSPEWHTAGRQTPGRQTPGRQTPGQQTPGRQTPGQQSPEPQTPRRQSSDRRVTFTTAQGSPYHTACILSAQNVDDLTTAMKKELKIESEKRRKLEHSLSHLQDELDKTKAMTEDVNQSKRLALAMLKQLHNEYAKLQRKYHQSIRKSQDSETFQRNQDSALLVQEMRLSSLSEQLQSEISKRAELENRLNREKQSRSLLEAALLEKLEHRDQQEDQIKPKQMDLRSVSSEEMFHDCQENQRPESPEQEKLKDYETLKQLINENEKVPKTFSDKSVNACDLNYDTDELIHVKERCAELEKQLEEKSAVSQELNAARKRCDELELQLKEYTGVNTELNEYRERLQKNVQQLHEVQSAFKQLQEAFKSAQGESNMRLEEKEKLITTLKENENLVNTENETLREIVKDLNELAQSYLERIQDLWNEKTKQEETLDQKLKELKEKEKSVSESGYELKVMCKKCTDQEKQIKDLQKVVNSLEDKYGHLTVESATYACENVVRRELLEDDIEEKREVLKDIEKKLENKDKSLEKQAYTIVQLRCRILKQDREIQRLQSELDKLYEDNMRNEEEIGTHKNFYSEMERLVQERDNAIRYAMFASHKLQLLKKILQMYLKKETKILNFLKHQIIKKHQQLIRRKLQQINYFDAKMYHDLRRTMSAPVNKRRSIQ